MGADTAHAASGSVLLELLSSRIYDALLMHRAANSKTLGVRSA